MIAEVLLWVSLGLLFYSYALYPLLMQGIAGKKNLDFKAYSKEELPEVAILFSAFNEQSVIEGKLNSTLNTYYPSDKLHVWVGSDASTDKTNEIVNEFIQQHASVKLIAAEKRAGKSAVLNKLVASLSSSDAEVLIFTDANVLFDPDTIYELVKYFKDEKIGLVAASVKSKHVYSAGISTEETSYILRENAIKYYESVNWGTMMGAFGAGYAIRKNCFATIPPKFLMEDFFESMHVLTKKYKAVQNPKAICYEDASVDLTEEYKRKVRINVGNFQNLFYYKGFLNLFFTPVFFTFFSHKLIRWAGPFLFIAAFTANCFLFNTNVFYSILLILQLLLLISPALQWIADKLHFSITLLRAASYFYVMNFAMLIGTIKFFTKSEKGIWTPTKRNI